MKNPIQNIREYLANRHIGKHRGANLLIKHSGYAFKIEEIIIETIQIIQQAFTKTSITNSGESKLTAMSCRIGECAGEFLGKYNRFTQDGEWNVVDMIKIGDLILEAFLYHKYIEINYTHYSCL